MNPIQDLKKIRAMIKEGDDMGLTSEEVMINIKHIIPTETEYIEKIVEVERKPTSTKEKLDYMRQWRKDKKDLKKIEQEDQKEALKIEKAKKRVSFFCYKCQKNVSINNPSDNEANIIQKPNRDKKSIIVSNKCPICSNKLSSFGGWL